MTTSLEPFDLSNEAATVASGGDDGPAITDDVLGIEGGGTKTTWARIAPDGTVRARGLAGPGNTLQLNDAMLEDLLRVIAVRAGRDVAAIGGAFAGCGQATECSRVEQAIRSVWPGSTVRVMDDTRSSLAAAFGDGPGIVVIAGTGSNVAGQKSLKSELESASGWGHLFSDRGSAYDLARRGMETVYAAWDAHKKVTALGCEFLKETKINSIEEMVPFLLRDISKATVAGYARCVFVAASAGDKEARALLDEGASVLAKKAVAVARRLGTKPLRVKLTGGLFDNQPDYRSRFTRALRKLVPKAEVNLATVAGAIGAARLARETLGHGENEGRFRGGVRTLAMATSLVSAALKPIAEPTRLAAFSAASTEQRNPRSRGLDRRTIPELVDLFIREERHVELALRAQSGAIARAAALIARKLRGGGRLIYVGAGTSGRLGVVDSSEMPPTFNAPPEQVQAIMAGGASAVFEGQEGAEDEREPALVELRARKLSKDDVVCGIAASGQTPFVLAALEEARRIGAGAILLSCNPKRKLRTTVDVAIDLPTGPELVTGSTRLKAGTATKLVLNMLSTIAMVRLGRVQDNFMINVQATNDKLRARCVRLVGTLAEVEADVAQRTLEANAWRVPASLEALKKSGAGNKLKASRKARQSKR